MRQTLLSSALMQPQQANIGLIQMLVLHFSVATSASVRRHHMQNSPSLVKSLLLTSQQHPQRLHRHSPILLSRVASGQEARQARMDKFFAQRQAVSHGSPRLRSTSATAT